MLYFRTVSVILLQMIKSFNDGGTEQLYTTGKSRKIPYGVWQGAIPKLDYLNAATSLNDLRQPPGNRLEALKGKLKGKHSIRINSQYRIVFKWQGADAYEVEIIDYH